MKLNDSILFYLCVCIFIVSLIIGFIDGFTTETISTFKPISLIQGTGFIIAAYLINKYKKFIMGLNRKWLVIFLFIALMISFYEICWVFNYWFSLYGITGINIDQIEYQTPSKNPFTEEDYKPINLNIGGKIWCEVFFIILYLFYVIHVPRGDYAS